MLSVPVQLIALKGRPRNDLLRVERDVKQLLTWKRAAAAIAAYTDGACCLTAGLLSRPFTAAVGLSLGDHTAGYSRLIYSLWVSCNRTRGAGCMMMAVWSGRWKRVKMQDDTIDYIYVRPKADE